MQRLIAVAESFLNAPYSWGGEDVIMGLDCSGLVQQILASAGEDPPGDQTAQKLFDWFYDPNHGKKGEGAGCLAFYGKSFKEVTHVAFCVDNWRMIEAGGGDPSIKTVTDAINANAFVRMRLINSRKDLLIKLKPYYVKIGLIP